MPEALIVGFGRAGRGLHLAAVDKLRAADAGGSTVPSHVFVYDEARIKEPPTERDDLTVLSTWRDVTAVVDPVSTVAHVCVPPASRLRVTRRLAESGVRQMILEKPLVDGLESLASLTQLRADYSLNVVAVANLLTSSLTRRVTDLLRAGTYGPLEHISFDLQKPRFQRSLGPDAHESAFEVEMPHAVVTALWLAGMAVSVVDATCEDLTVGRVTVRSLGSAALKLKFDSGVTCDIASNLRAPIRQRVMELSFARGRLNGFYAPSDADNYSQLTGDPQPDDPRESAFYDDSFFEFIGSAYEHFSTDLPFREGGFELAARTVEILAIAKEMCDLVPSRVAAPLSEDEYLVPRYG